MLDLFVRLHEEDDNGVYVPFEETIETAQTILGELITLGLPPLEVDNRYFGIALIWRGKNWTADVNVLNDKQVLGYVYGNYQEVDEFNFLEDTIASFVEAVRAKMLEDENNQTVEQLVQTSVTVTTPVTGPVPPPR